MTDPVTAAFFRLHDGLPRQGPGSDDATREALGRLGPLPAAARILDLGCGPGRQTLLLAACLGTPITAVDQHGPFLEALAREAERLGVAHLVETRRADFGALDDPPGSAGLLWSEGAIYVLGWAEGLRRWRPLLCPGGRMALTELTWLSDDPPEEAAEYFRAVYPGMGTLRQNVEAAEAAGLRVLDTFVLPPSAWWDEYYGPLRARIEWLGGEAAGDPALAQVLDEAEAEIALNQKYGDSYGYVFYLLQAR